MKNRTIIAGALAFLLLSGCAQNAGQPVPIGADAAAERAMAAAGVRSTAAENTSVSKDSDADLYHVVFHAGEQQYRYDIDALTGEVVGFTTQKVGGAIPAQTEESLPSPPESSPPSVDPGAAEQPAASPASSSSPTIQSPVPDAPAVSASPSPSPSAAQQPAVAPTPSVSYIGEEAAKASALAHSGADINAVFFTGCELEHDNGHHLYDIEFCWNGRAYDYEIDACSGAVMDCDIGRCDHAAHHSEPHHGDQHHGSATSVSYIGTDAACKAVCDYLGISVTDMLGRSIEFDQENGIYIYEVEFCWDGREYDCEVDAGTGAIIKCNSERCDHHH